MAAVMVWVFYSTPISYAETLIAEVIALWGEMTGWFNWGRHNVITTDICKGLQ